MEDPSIEAGAPEDLAVGEFTEYMRLWSKRYLGRIRATVHTVAMLRSEIRELEESMDGVHGIDYTRQGEGGAAADEAMMRRIARKDSLVAEFGGELERNLQWQADAHRALAHVRQPWRAVLTYRYVEGMMWADVADAVGYSEDHVRKDMHDNGLVELYPFIPHEYDELPGAV